MVGLVVAAVLAIEVIPKAEYWLLGILTGQTLLAIVGKKIFELKARSHVPPDMPADRPARLYFHALYRFAWPLSLAVGFGWAQSQGYRFVMERSVGLVELGLFVAGYSISAGVIAAFESVLTTYFQPQFYKRMNSNDISTRTSAWNAYASALFPSLLITVFFIGGLSQELSKVLLGPAFQAASVFVLWGAVAEAVRVLVGAFSLVAHSEMRTRLLLQPNAIGAALAIGLGLVLIPSLGGTGAGIALSLSALALLSMMNMQMRKQLAIKLPIKRLSFSFLSGVALLIAAFAIKQLMPNGGSILVSISILGIIGSFYLVVQYLLLAPVLHRPLKHT